MASAKKDQPSDAPKPKAVRRSGDALIADTARPGKSPNGATGTKSPRTPPPNARVIKYAPVKGTVSRAAARAAARRANGKS